LSSITQFNDLTQSVASKQTLYNNQSIGELKIFSSPIFLTNQPTTDSIILLYNKNLYVVFVTFVYAIMPMQPCTRQWRSCGKISQSK